MFAERHVDEHTSTVEAEGTIPRKCQPSCKHHCARRLRCGWRWQVIQVDDCHRLVRTRPAAARCGDQQPRLASLSFLLAFPTTIGHILQPGSPNIPHPPKELKRVLLDVHFDGGHSHTVCVRMHGNNGIYIYIVHRHISTTSYAVQYFLPNFICKQIPQQQLSSVRLASAMACARPTAN